MVARRSLAQVTASGAVWFIVQNAGARVAGFLSQLVLAAILSPSDFGQVGLAYTVTTFGAILTNFGVDSVLLQRQATIRMWVVPAFWYSFGVGTLGFLLVLAIGPMAARMYGLPQVAMLAAITALSIPITALATLPVVLLRARFRFREIAAITFTETVLIQGLAIAGALAGLGAFAFVLPLPVVALGRTILLWFLCTPDLSGLFSRARRLRYLVGSSIAVLGTGLVQSCIGQGSYIMLGIVANDAAVGVYFFAFKMASQPLLLMANSLSNVLFPALSHLRNAPEAQGAAAIRSARLLGLLIMPLAFLQAGLIEPTIHVFFASKWDDSIPLMQVLSVALGFDAISWIAGTLLTAQRGFRTQFLYVLAFSPAYVLLVVVGGLVGAGWGVALGVAAYYVVVSPLYSYVVFRRYGVGGWQLLIIYLRPAGVAAVSVGGALAATSALGLHNDTARIVSISAIMGAGCLCLFWLVDRAGVRDARNLIVGMLLRKTQPAI